MFKNKRDWVVEAGDVEVHQDRKLREEIAKQDKIIVILAWVVVILFIFTVVFLPQFNDVICNQQIANTKTATSCQ